MNNEKLIIVIETIVFFSVLTSFFIVFSVSFSGLQEITGYTTFITSPTTNLTVWDDTNDAEGENSVHYAGEYIGFYANFTNKTGDIINGNCEIKFNLSSSWAGLDNMTFNALTGLYEYNKNFSSAGSYFFNILCDGSALGYDILNATDDFVVSPSQFLNDCTDLSLNGTYLLQNDIIDSSTSYCMNILANDVILDCQGYKIDGDGVADYGIYISRPAPENTNIIIRNCIVSNWDTAGIRLFLNIDNIIYNNVFNNTNNVDIFGTFLNNWNMTKTSGTNIVNGNYLGGNFWANPSGTGFSENCTDVAPFDDICDVQYNVTGDGNNIDYLPLAVPDDVPFVSLVAPLNATQSTTDSYDFNCDSTDNGDLENITLYIWNSTGGIYYQNSVNISGTSNSSIWTVSSLIVDEYEWNCEAFDNFGQSNFAIANYNLIVEEAPAPPSGGGGGGGGAVIEDENVTEEVGDEEIVGVEEETETYFSAEEAEENTEVTGDVTIEGDLEGTISNLGGGNLRDITILVYEKPEETGSGTDLSGAVNERIGISNPITGFVVQNRVDIEILEEGFISETNPLIIQKYVQYNIGPGVYVSTSQVNQKPLRTEPIKQYIAPLLRPGESLTFEINLSLGLSVKDKVLIMEFRSFDKTFATREIVLKATPPVFGFTLDQSEEEDVKDVYVIISNINQEKTDYHVGLELNRLPDPEYKRETGILGLFNSITKGPIGMYYDYLGPYTLDTDESTLLTQRFILNEIPEGNYTFDAILYYDHMPLSRISHDMDVKR